MSPSEIFFKIVAAVWLVFIVGLALFLLVSIVPTGIILIFSAVALCVVITVWALEKLLC